MEFTPALPFLFACLSLVSSKFPDCFENWNQSLLIVPIVLGHTLLGRNEPFGSQDHAIRTCKEGPKPCNGLIGILSFTGHDGISCDFYEFNRNWTSIDPKQQIRESLAVPLSIKNPPKSWGNISSVGCWGSKGIVETCWPRIRCIMKQEPQLTVPIWRRKKKNKLEMRCIKLAWLGCLSLL